MGPIIGLGRLRQYPPRLRRTLPAAPTPPGNAPSISVVVPSFNQGHFLGETLRSIDAQAYPDLEVWVQDGQSTDTTQAVLQDWNPDGQSWVSEPDEGQADALNRGFAHSAGDVMGWLNSDDLYLPQALHCVGRYFAEHPNVDVVYGDRLLIDEQGREIGIWLLPGHSDRVLRWVDYVPQETLFWRRRIWEAVGGFVDSSFSFAMDWELLLRFRAAGARMAHISRLLGAFRVHAAQKTSSQINDLGQQEMQRLRRMHLGREPSRLARHLAVAPYLFRHAMRHRCGRGTHA